MRSTICFLACLLLCSCAGLLPPDTDAVDEHQGITEINDDIHHSQLQDQGAVTFQEGLYVGGAEAVPLGRAESLPSIFSEPLVLRDSPMHLAALGNLVTSLSGMPVDIAPRMEGKTKYNLLRREMQVSYSGDLKGFLDTIAGYYGLYWEYSRDNGVVRLFRLKTRTFSLVATAGTVSISNFISNSSKTSGSSGGEGSAETESEGAQEAEVTSEFSIWDEVAQNVAAILSDQGRAVPNQASNTITVTDTPTVLEAVSEYVADMNARLARQVALTVRVYSLSTDTETSHGINLNVIFEKLDGAVAGSLTNVSPFENLTGSGLVAAGVVEGSTSHFGRQLGGSELILKALQAVGKVSLLTSGSGITLNGQPMPLQVVQRVGYLAEVSTTTTTDVGTTAELTAGQVTTGFSMIITPNIMDNNQVVLQYTVTLSSLDRLNEVESGDQLIQTPETSTRSFLQRVAVPLGSTLVLAGFEQARRESDDQSGLFQVSRETDNNRQLLVIAIEVNSVAGAH